jgi:hypothetical protein
MRRAVVATGLLLILTGCSPSPPGPGPLFDNEGGVALTCMKHQPALPGTRYTDLALRNTVEILNVLRYYTANGNKPYCDRNPATGIDKEWAKFYLAQGTVRSNVASILNR